MSQPILSRRHAMAQLGGTIALLGLAGSADAGPLERGFDRLARAEGYDDKGPGLAVLVQARRGPLLMGSIGLARLKDHKPVTPATMFELASVSKPITATAVLILHDRGKLSVNDDIRKHLPEMPEFDAKRPIRIQNLLQHTSGLPSYMDFGDVPARNKDYWVNEDYVGEFARQKAELQFPTGQQFAYNNSNYMLLGAIIARVAKVSYGTFLREAIFEPAGMKTAFVQEGPGSVPESAERTDAIGYVQADGKWREEWGTPPARNETLLTVGDGAIWCSLEDMSAWDRALIGGKLLKAATAKQAIMPSKTHDGKTNTYGLGWSLYYTGAARPDGFWHGGGWGGFGTYYYHDLTKQRTTVMLGNGRPLDMDKFWYALMELVDNQRKK